MRIGEVLLEHNLDWETLAEALLAQRKTKLRLASLLIARGAISFDQASIALGAQHGFAAALRRHLEGRDRSVAALLPAEVGRRHIALPIGYQGDGKLVVCVRDPSLALREQLSRTIGKSLVLAVAPARTIERLVEHVYADIDVPIDVDMPAPPDFAFDVDMAFTRLELADSKRHGDAILDDASEAAEELGGDIPVEIEAPAPKSRALPVQIKRLDTAAIRDSLDTTIEALADTDDLEWLLDVVMAYLVKRWSAALILALEDRRAVGLRGHGDRLKPSATRAFVLPLSEPSIVQLARDERRIISDTPPEAAKRLSHVLDDAPEPIAVPLTTRTIVTHVLVVGAPLRGWPEDTIPDLEVLAEAMSETLTRIAATA
jgi:hypothetical protein